MCANTSLPFSGKAMQKQKSKNKLKPRDLNRKGAEKEGTDMDAFVNPVSAPKAAEIKQDNKDQHAPVPTRDSNKESGREISKDIKEKDNYESKKEKEILPVHPKVEKTVVVPEVVPPKEVAPVQTTHVVDKLPINKEVPKESSPMIEDSAKPIVCNAQPKPVVVPNDVVDHAKIKEEINLEALVAQKNEENFKVSALLVSNDESVTPAVTPVVLEKKQQQQPEIEAPSSGNNTSANITALRQPQLKYTYKEGQWSPINTEGKKFYDRDFLMKLQHDPNCKVKPPNLPNLQAVLKDNMQVKFFRRFFFFARAVYTRVILLHLVYVCTNFRRSTTPPWI